MPKAKSLSLALLFVLALSPTLVYADWEDCEGFRHDREWGDDGRYCELRELELAALPHLTVDAGRNGGIKVEAWDEPSIHVVARISVWDASEEKARRIVDSIRIEENGGVLGAQGAPREGWSVSYRIRAPRMTDLDLEAHNGGISVAGIEGVLRLRTQNGGLSLAALSGDVEARTTNGGVKVELAGSYWDGLGLDVETSNGGVDLEIPEGYSAELETGTVNGRISVDFPVTVVGRIGKEIRTTLGSGGAPIRVRTTNGGVTVSSR